VTLSSTPTALLALAAGNSNEAKSAQSILDAVTWAGKPAPPAVTPLTAAEQARFTAGQAVFQTRCVACHGAQGQGIEHQGAKLAGSPMVAAGQDVMIHILLNGKEGTIGLMPPLGATMSDDELAQVITYVKRAFGNTAAPVQPAQVKETRALNVDRKTPWTDAELLGGGGRGGGRGGAAAGGGRGGAAAGAGRGG
jgi:mono/diheme cytochrome c family protein